MSEWNDEVAEWYAENYGEYATNRLAVDALDVPSPASVLDVGCGTGAALRHASERWPDATLLGVDPSRRMVEIANERLVDHPRRGSIEIREGSAESLSAEDASFDLVLAFDSLDHWGDRRAGAREVSRVVSDDGRLVVVKDLDSPGGEGDVAAVTELFRAEGDLALERVDRLEGEGVSFRLWIFHRATPPG